MSRWFRFPWRLLLILVIVALCAVACMSAPLAPGAVEITVAPTEAVVTPAPTSEVGEAPQKTPQIQSPAVLEARRLTLEWPSKIRKGDADIVRLTLEMDELGNLTPTAMVEGHETRGETVYIPNVYDTHTVIAEARLDLAGMEVSPGEVIAQALLPGKAVSFFWSVSPDEVGSFRGTVWLKLRFLPLDGGPESERMLTSQIIEIQSVNLLGLGGASARLLGGLGAVLGGMIGADDLVKWLWEWWKKRKQRTTRK